MNKLMLIAIMFLGMGASAQTFEANNDDVRVSLDFDNDKVVINEYGDERTCEIAWISNFPVTHSDFAVFDDKVYAIRMKQGLRGGKVRFTRMVVINKDYSKEKYKLL